MFDVTNVELPNLCTVCLNNTASQIIPNRGANEFCDNDQFEILCPLCFDALLGVFPICTYMFHNRELSGKLQRRRLKRISSPR